MKIKHLLKAGALVAALTLAGSRSVLGETSAVSETWLGEVPPHRAVCMSGTSPSQEDFAGVKDRFVASLDGVPRFGNIFFDSLAVDPQAKSATWRICVPVEASVQAPAGLAAQDFAATPAVFALCSGSATAGQCSQEATRLLSGRLSDPAQKEAASKLPTRGARSALKSPLGEADRLAAQSAVASTDLGKDALHVPDAQVAPLKDSTARRPVLVQPAQQNASRPPGEDGYLVAVPIPGSLLETVKAAFAPAAPPAPPPG